jgi:stringent starvation protein B
LEPKLLQELVQELMQELVQELVQKLMLVLAREKDQGQQEQEQQEQEQQEQEQQEDAGEQTEQAIPHSESNETPDSSTQACNYHLPSA